MKNARPVSQPSALDSVKPIKLTPRLERLLRALLADPNGISREQADRTIPASNSPEYIRQLRRRLCLEIPCVMVRFVTTDWTESKRGIYRLTEEDRQQLEAFLK
jgi:hypothetical protein